MKSEFWSQLILILVGLFVLVSAVANWDFFFNNRKAQVIVKIFTRIGARIFYSILGIVLIVLGLFYLN